MVKRVLIKLDCDFRSNDEMRALPEKYPEGFADLSRRNRTMCHYELEEGTVSRVRVRATWDLYFQDMSLLKSVTHRADIGHLTIKTQS